VIARRPHGWIDAARIAAIFAVVVIHVVYVLTFRPDLPESWWFGNLLDSMARWSVPVFVMISGYLALNSTLADEPTAFWRRRLSRIAVPLAVWSGIYLVVGHIYLNRPATIGEAVDQILAGSPYYHMYFVYLIAGLYLVTPFLRPLARGPNDRLLGLATIVFLAIGVGDTFITIWTGAGGFNAITRFVAYVGYYLAGAWLARQSPSRGARRIAAAVIVGGISLTAVGTAALVPRVGFAQAHYPWEYLSITTVAVSCAVFLLFAWSGPVFEGLSLPTRRWIAELGAATFGIYLIHPLVLIGWQQVGLEIRTFPVPLATLAIVALTVSVSAALVQILRRIPVLRRTV
jgi:surface polysaccharide O-acyltransferase-like enzyme